MTAWTRLTTAGTAAVMLLGSGLGSGSAAAESANGTPVQLGLTYRACDFSKVTFVTAFGTGSGNATIGTGGTNTVTADVFFMIGKPNTPYRVRLIQGPRSRTQTCNPGDPGVASAVMTTDANGVGRISLHDTVRSGATNAWVFVEAPPDPGRVQGEFFTSDILTSLK